MIGIERFCLSSPHTLVLGDSVSGRPWPSVRELGPAPCLLGNWRRMPHPTTQHRCLKQEHPASVSSALIDVIDLVPRQDDPEGQQDKHPGNGPPGVPPLRADRRTSESRLGRRVHFLLVMGCPVHAPLVLGPTAWRRGRMMDRSLSLLLMIDIITGLGRGVDLLRTGLTSHTGGVNKYREEPVRDVLV